MRIGIVLSVIAILLIVVLGFLSRDTAGTSLHLGGKTLVYRTNAVPQQGDLWKVSCFDIEARCLVRGGLLCPDGFLVSSTNSRLARLAVPRMMDVDRREFSLVLDCGGR